MKMFWKKKKVQDLNHILPFLRDDYQQHNVARLSHLESLNLSLNNRTVLELGSGIGDHTLFYLYKGCKVVASDGRTELVKYIRNRLGIECLELDVENDLSKLNDLPKFDIIHCYGLLYHINNPEEFLQNIAKKTDLLLLETCVSPDSAPYGPNFIEESKKDPTQAKSGLGCRPTRQWIIDELKRQFNFIYFPKSQPDHPEFPKDWTSLSPSGNALIRVVFIAANNELNNEKLTNNLPKKYL